jgi:hypothetical protein
MNISGKAAGIVSALVSVGAGLYLLSANSPSVAGVGGSSWFEVLAHGIGIYFIARGIYMAPALWMQEEQNENTRKLLELQEMRHSDPRLRELDEESPTAP